MPRTKKSQDEKVAMQRMDKALKAAMTMPPRKHKDELKGRKEKKPGK